MNGGTRPSLPRTGGFVEAATLGSSETLCCAHCDPPPLVVEKVMFSSSAIGRFCRSDMWCRPMTVSWPHPPSCLLAVEMKFRTVRKCNHKRAEENDRQIRVHAGCRLERVMVMPGRRQRKGAGRATSVGHRCENVNTATVRPRRSIGHRVARALGVFSRIVVNFKSVLADRFSLAEWLLRTLACTGQLALTLHMAHVVVGLSLLEAMVRPKHQSLPMALGSTRCSAPAGC